MDCSKWSADISAYLDGSLEPARTPALLEHLEVCPECASFYQEHLRITQLFSAALPDQDPPESIWLGIESRLATGPALEERPFRWNFIGWFRVPQLGYALAAAVVCVLVGLVLLQKPEDNSKYLAELEAYTIEVQGNPFQERMGTENPFLQLSHFESGNPFEGLGGSKQ